MTKTYLAIVCLLINLSVLSAAKVIIIESQSLHTFHRMDLNWKALAESNGHEVSLLTQDALTQYELIHSADVLIISSGLIQTTEAHRANIQRFVSEGGNLFIQSEYQINNPGNMLFADLVNNNGGQFEWTGENTGGLSPMQIDRTVLPTTSEITQLDYYWYGTYGKGDHTVQPFLSHQNKNYGFLFCPPNPTLGKILTTSDQDWVRANTQPQVMSDLLEYLVQYPALDQLPTLTIESDTDSPCEGTSLRYVASTQTNNLAFSYQWIVNGQKIDGATEAVFVSTQLNNNDQVQCLIRYDYDCGNWQSVSNVLSVEIKSPSKLPQLTVLSDRSRACQFAPVTFTAQVPDMPLASNLRYQWLINNSPEADATDLVFVTDQLNDQDKVSFQLTYDDACQTDHIAQAAPLTIVIQPLVTPTLRITSATDTICAGQTASFTASGEHWGPQSRIQWMVNGQLVAGVEGAVFTTTDLTDGQRIKCVLFANLECAAQQLVEAEITGPMVNTQLDASAAIIAEQASFCAGSQARFRLEGMNLGAQPTYQWTVNGQTVGTSAPTLVIDQIEAGQLVECTVVSDLACQTSNVIAAEPFEIVLTTLQMETLEISEEHCDQADGLIEVQTTNGTAPFNYQWSNGQQGSVLTGLAADTYQLQITDANGCQLDTSLVVTAAQDLTELTIETTAANCRGRQGSARLEVKKGQDLDIRWFDAQNNTLGRGEQLEQLLPGTYYLAITNDYGCQQIDSIEIGQTVAIDLQVDYPSQVNLGETIEITTTNINGQTLNMIWQDNNGQNICTNCEQLTLEATTDQFLRLITTDEFGCQVVEEMVIRVIPDRSVYIPNAFSPNADGNNDQFTLFGGANVQMIKRLSIADRWGNILFARTDLEINDESAGWDGQFRGQRMPIGVYAYVAEVQFADGRTEIFSGDINLLP